MTKKPEIVPATKYLARKLIDSGAELEMETVLLDGKLAWRANLRMPGQTVIYRAIVHNTLKTKYFKSLGSALEYYTSLLPKAEKFCIIPTPSEKVSEQD